MLIMLFIIIRFNIQNGINNYIISIIALLYKYFQYIIYVRYIIIIHIECEPNE